MTGSNYLIGRGELLAQDIKAPRTKPKPKIVYSLKEAKARLFPQIEATSEYIDALPAESCPLDSAVIRVALNPGFIAKSYFPKSFLRAVDLEVIGSRAAELVPEKWSKKSIPRMSETTELFVSGTRQAFRSIPSVLEGENTAASALEQFSRVERIAPFTSSEKIVGIINDETEYFEIGLHLPIGVMGGAIQQKFMLFAETKGIDLRDDLAFDVGNLWFVPGHGKGRLALELAEFGYVRVLRELPRLRGIRPLTRGVETSISCELPDSEAISNDTSVAILDGGLPESSVLSKWVGKYTEMDEAAAPDPDGVKHGQSVTSAFLFGSIDPKGSIQRPYSNVDHVRVIDQLSDAEDPYELPRTLGHVEEILLSRQYEFLNLSLGPDLPIEDTEVHAWTSVIDDHLSDGETFLTVAAGNNGELDEASGNSRVQVPGDSVNSVCVGAADSQSSAWSKARYSAIGPGRSPGLVKPDLVAFGGDPSEYFHAVLSDPSATIAPTMGTSFAAPNLLRHAVAIRAILGRDLSPLAIKALLINAADRNNLRVQEVGWGRVPSDVFDVISSGDGVARIIYQGELKSGKYLRAPIPIPPGGLSGKVRISATFCYAADVDPQDTPAYTRSGLEVVFRPSDQKKRKDSESIASKTFFSKPEYATESELRSDYGKWETVLSDACNMYGSSLVNPAFDVHYVARDGGAQTSRLSKMKYSLVVTIEATRHANIYDEILKAYSSILVPVEPRISIPVRV